MAMRTRADLAKWKPTVRRLTEMARRCPGSEFARLRREVHPGAEADQPPPALAKAISQAKSTGLNEAKRRLESLLLSRERYRSEFGEIIKLRDIDSVIRLEIPFSFEGYAHPAYCEDKDKPTDPGIFEATAEMEVVGGSLRLHPFIHSSPSRCNFSSRARVVQVASYAMAAPSRTFHIQGVALEISGVGYGLAVNGTFDSNLFFPVPPTSAMTLGLYMEQHIPGVEFGGIWPFSQVSLFSETGEYSRAIEITSQFAALDYYLKGAPAGGGDIYCFLCLESWAEAVGARAEALIDFSTASGLAIEVTGIGLLGEYV